MADQPRVHYLRLVDVLMIVIVLNTRQCLFYGRLVDECSADPIVDETVRYTHRRLPRPELRQDVAFTNVTGTSGILVRPQEMSASIQRRFHTCFGFTNVRQKHQERFLCQLHGSYTLSHQSLTFSHRELRVLECQARDADVDGMQRRRSVAKLSASISSDSMECGLRTCRRSGHGRSHFGTPRDDRVPEPSTGASTAESAASGDQPGRTGFRRRLTSLLHCNILRSILTLQYLNTTF